MGHPSVPSEGLLEDMNELQIVLVVTITETKQIIYTTAAVITEILGYKMNSDMEQTSPWRMRLKANIKAALTEVSQLLELQKSVIKKMSEKYSKLPIQEARHSRQSLNHKQLDSTSHRYDSRLLTEGANGTHERLAV